MPVVAKPEYERFDLDVRQPGLVFLGDCPQPTSAQFGRHRYWSKALPHLRAAYDSQCAYTSRRLMEGGSVDHFWPKACFPSLAYEWDNYRFARRRINENKGASTGIVDPFEVGEGWFVLQMPSCLIATGVGLGASAAKRVQSTIDVLRLNLDDDLVQERCDLLVNLADRCISIEFLDWFYPFLSSEVRRQGVQRDLARLFSRIR